MYWLEDRDGAPGLLALYERHYSTRHYKDGRKRTLCVGPGYRLVLTTLFYQAAIIWKIWKDPSGETGIYCQFFRNESAIKSSELLQEGMNLAIAKWPDENRMYTYVNRDKVSSKNPGYCYKVIGWKFVHKTKNGLDVLEFKIR